MISKRAYSKHERLYSIFVLKIVRKKFLYFKLKYPSESVKCLML